MMKIGCLFAFTLVTAFSARADLVSSTGQVNVIPPPADVRVNIGIESDTVAFFFPELRDFVLPSAVAVNITTPGAYSSTASLTPGTIGAGKGIDSYYLHADPVGDTSTVRTYDGTLTFNTPILGVIVLDAQFAASNGVVGHPGTLYSASGQGLELGSPDSVSLAISGETLTFHFGTNTAADDIRILTAASVPEPGSFVLVGSGCLLIGLSLRRRVRRG